MKIFLYGPSGSGKSTIGRELAEQLSTPLFDIDAAIEEKIGKPITNIFTDEGEAFFRKLESETLAEAIQSPAEVIALGGGALLDDQNRQLAEQNGAVVCLSAPLDVLASRLNGESNLRPLLAGDTLQRLEIMLERRKSHYASFPLHLDTANLKPDEAAWNIQVLTGRFHVSGMGSPYDVFVQPGGLESIPCLLKAHHLRAPLALVADRAVDHLYGDRLAQILTDHQLPVQRITFAGGETLKTIRTIETFWEGFVRGRLDRRSTVIALGGGVTGDLAGFAAATYLRGINWVCLPTTLLAMIDSSLGGKTGADLPQGKNLIGAFHAPRLVLADPLTLSTLPEREMRGGLAEVVKHGLIGDTHLYSLCAQGLQAIQADWTALVRRAMAVKVHIIQQDPYERGLRQALNLGHTIGHGVELASAFTLLHGECVAIGMVAATRISEAMGIAEKGLTEEITDTLTRLGLPVEIPASINREDVRRAMLQDKKRIVGKLTFVLPVKIGEVLTGVEVADWEKYIL